MKILHTADWHIGKFKSPMRDGVNLRTEDIKRCLDEVVMAAKEEQPDYTLVSGDIFDVGHLWSDRCCEEILTADHYIRELRDASKRVIVMRGTPNHDGSGQFNVLSEMFSGCPNVHVVTTPQVLQFPDVDIAVLPGFDAGFYRARFPGMSKEEENMAFTQELSNIVLGLRAQCREGKANILMAHYTVPGCNTESGQEMGMAKFEPVLPPETLQAAGFSLVALGHIHRPQAVPGVNDCYYSGAINAMNFNDEGQERGFWIHESLSHGGWFNTFYKTPYRQFITLKFTDTDIAAINRGGMDEVAMNHWRWNGAVADKIVRIQYSCSAENIKAYKAHGAAVERALLEDGAFMLWENLPEKINEYANREELAGTTAPEANLIRYLEEKQFTEEKIQEIVLKARPVIAMAEACMPAAANTGMFEPVEIAVKNYRNYVEETFDFSSVSFCTINGANGAGKSSLFMDAITDCLYEKTREGDKTGWIRNDEKARSGSIMFTFRIGEKIFRVTRTRARSGKGTLNLSELVAGEWENRSKEKWDDTQQQIIDIIGMDSLTFKSCALIMQDQYGLFLQAKPEERMEVLGTLLGLGVYQIMEKAASEKAKIYMDKGRALQQKMEVHAGTMAQLGKPDDEISDCQSSLEKLEADLKGKAEERDGRKLLLATRQEAAERRTRLLADIGALEVKKATAQRNKAGQEAVIASSKAVLASRQEIENKVAEYNAKMEEEKLLAGEAALYSSKLKEAENFRKQEEDEKKSIERMKARVREKETELEALKPTGQDEVIRKNAAEYERQKRLLDEAYEKERCYRKVDQEITLERHSLQQLSTRYEADIKRMQLGEDSYKKKAEMLSDVDCVDISNAKCGFLADAIEAKKLLAGYPERYAERKKLYEENTAPVNARITALEKKLEGMEFDSGAVGKISQKIVELKPYVTRLDELNQREGRIALIKADIGHMQSNIQEAEKRLCVARLQGTEACRERDRCKKSFEGHTLVQNEILALKPWLEKERQIPVAEERQATAVKRMAELENEISGIDEEIAGKQEEERREKIAMDGIEGLAGEVARLDAEVDGLNFRIKECQIKIGGLKQKSDQLLALKKEMAALEEQMEEAGRETSHYEVLKAAFSQNGVPHQIIRSVIPQLTSISNSILGQMTGGKMGVEFRLEHIQKNGKEKASLDIFIEECGKAPLPYLSKSGGEKVKASLSVILALAEIKSSSAGIQLGFLQIDEPPFLDSDGTQAYVDALESIRDRYQRLKVMAITHDQEFKARFPQSVTVYKDDGGSHVMWD